jgi:hypothetical protein
MQSLGTGILQEEGQKTGQQGAAQQSKAVANCLLTRLAKPERHARQLYYKPSIDLCEPEVDLMRLLSATAFQT